MTQFAQQFSLKYVETLCGEYEITDSPFIQTMLEAKLSEEKMIYLLEKANDLIDSPRDVVPCWLLLEVNQTAHDEIHLEAIFAKARELKGRMGSIRAIQRALNACSYHSAELDI